MNVFELFAKISLNTSEYEKGLKDSESKMKTVGSAISGGLSKAAKIGASAIGVATTAVGALTKKSIDRYAQYEQLVGGIDTLFKKSSKRVQKYADDAYKTAGMSANNYMETAIQSSAAMINSLGGDTEKAAEMTNMAITDMSDNMNKMGTNMQSLQDAYRGFSRSNFTMLDNLALGYAGTKEGMQSLLDDAEKISGIKYDIRSYSDIVQAIHVIQEEMNITGTTAKESSTTIEGSLNSMKAAWENLLTGISNGDADVGKLTSDLVDTAKTAFSNLLPVAKQALVGIGEFVGGIAPVISEELPELVTQVLPMAVQSGTQLLTGITKGLLGNAQKLLTAAVQIVTQLSDGLSKNAPILMPKAVLIISSLVQFLINQTPQLVKAALSLIVSLGDGLIKSLPALAREIPKIVNGIIDALLEMIPDIIEAGIELLTSLADGLPNIINNVVQMIPEIVEHLVDAMIKNAPKIAEAGFKLIIAIIKNLPKMILQINMAGLKIVGSLVETLYKQIPKLASAGLKLLKSLWDNLPEIIRTGKENVTQIWHGIKDKISGFSLVQAGVNLIKGLWDGIVATKDWLFDKVGDLGKGLVNKVKDVFKIKSPSRVFAEIGKFLALGLGEGWEDAFPDVQNGIEDDLAFDVGQAVSDIEASVSTTGTDGGMYTLSDVYHMMSRILESIETSGMNTVSAIENTDTSIVLNDREFGRAVRKVYA